MAAAHSGVLASTQRVCTGASTSRAACRPTPVTANRLSLHRHTTKPADRLTASCSSRLEHVPADELSRYERIRRFVEDAECEYVSLRGPELFGEHQQPPEQWVPENWYHSYDEEAEEGSSDSDEQEDAHLLASSSNGPASSSVYAMPFYRSRLENMEQQQPAIIFSYDEEAAPSTAWDVATANSPSAAMLTSTTAAINATAVPASQQLRRKRPSRSTLRIARARRAAIAACTRAVAACAPKPSPRPYYGPLERCEPWVDPLVPPPSKFTPATAAAAAASAAAAAIAKAKGAAAPVGSYGAMLASSASSVTRSAVQPLAGGIEEVLARLRAADMKLGEFRPPQAWHLTFDEDVHGSSDEVVPVLASC